MIRCHAYLVGGLVGVHAAGWVKLHLDHEIAALGDRRLMAAWSLRITLFLRRLTAGVQPFVVASIGVADLLP